MLAAGIAAGGLARLLDVYGPKPLSRIGGGLALWLTLAFVAAQAARSWHRAIAGALVFLSAWLLGYYVTDAELLGVRITTMWPVARPWLILLMPASACLGLSARCSTRSGHLADSALCVPVTLAIVEGLLVAVHDATVTGVAVTSVLLAAAGAVVQQQRRRRRVQLHVVVAASGTALLPFGAIVLWMMHSVI